MPSDCGNVDKVTVTEFEAGERLDKVLTSEFSQYSRSALEKLILSGHVTINGTPKRSSYRVKATDMIEVDLTIFSEPAAEIDLEVVFEDDDVVVLNKPAGVLTHAKGTLHNEATVATWLKAHVSNIDQIDSDFWDSNRAGIVHRLDRGTSGIIVCAKNEQAQTFLQKQFASRKVKKTYIAVINGEMPEQTGKIDVPIERNPKQPATFRPGINGKSAQTDFAVISVKNGYSLVELSPFTGRTHQLRVHLQYLKHPIVGDEMYEGEKASRLMLHAKQIELTLPSRERKTFSTVVPVELTDYVA